MLDTGGGCECVTCSLHNTLASLSIQALQFSLEEQQQRWEDEAEGPSRHPLRTLIHSGRGSLGWTLKESILHSLSSGSSQQERHHGLMG